MNNTTIQTASSTDPAASPSSPPPPPPLSPTPLPSYASYTAPEEGAEIYRTHEERKKEEMNKQQEKENTRPVSALASYSLPFHTELLYDMYAHDALVILGRGLGLDYVLLQFLSHYIVHMPQSSRLDATHSDAKHMSPSHPSSSSLTPPSSTSPYLLFLLNFSEEQIQFFNEVYSVEYAGKRRGIRSINNEFPVAERQRLYLAGGLLAITSRILTVDLLNKVIAPDLIYGIVVNKAHQVTDTSAETFILRIYRHANVWGFIKAFSDDSTAFTRGHSLFRVEEICKNLYVNKVFLWPRFHLSIKASIRPPSVVEYQQPFTAHMNEVQRCLVECIDTCITALKRDNRLFTGDTNTSSSSSSSNTAKKGDAYEEWSKKSGKSGKSGSGISSELNLTVEQSLTKHFDNILRSELDPLTHTLSSKSHHLLADLTLLRNCISFLISYDCITFYKYLLNLKSLSSSSSGSSSSSSSAAGNYSHWMLSDSADQLFKYAKARVYEFHPAIQPLSSTLKSNSHSTHSNSSSSATSSSFATLARSLPVDKVSVRQDYLSLVLEENPKWQLLLDILQDIELNLPKQYLELKQAYHSKHNPYTTSPSTSTSTSTSSFIPPHYFGHTLIITRDTRTATFLTRYLSLGGNTLMRGYWKRYLYAQKLHTRRFATAPNTQANVGYRNMVSEYELLRQHFDVLAEEEYEEKMVEKEKIIEKLVREKKIQLSPHILNQIQMARKRPAPTASATAAAVPSSSPSSSPSRYKRVKVDINEVEKDLHLHDDHTATQRKGAAEKRGETGKKEEEDDRVDEEKMEDEEEKEELIDEGEIMDATAAISTSSTATSSLLFDRSNVSIMDSNFTMHTPTIVTPTSTSPPTTTSSSSSSSTPSSSLPPTDSSTASILPYYQIMIHPYKSVHYMLTQFHPHHVIVFDPDMSIIRELEVYQSLPSTLHNLHIHFLLYSNSLEEQKYVNTLNAEKLSFETLIKNKSRMVLAIDQHQKQHELQMKQKQEELSKQQGIEINKSEKTIYPQGLYGKDLGADDGGGMRNSIYEAYQSTLALPQDSRKAGLVSGPGSILVDVREFRSSLPSMLHAAGIHILPVTLEIADYILTPTLAIERKSLPDLIGSFASGRLYKQMEQAIRSYKTPVLLIEFERNKPFMLTAKHELTNEISAKSLISKLCLLILHFPAMRLVWSRDSHHTTQLFLTLKKNQPQPSIQQAIVCGSIKSAESGGVIGGGEEDREKESLQMTPHDILRKLPGVNNNNIRLLLANVSTLKQLCQTPLKQLEVWMGGQAFAKKLYNFLHADQR